MTNAEKTLGQIAYDGYYEENEGRTWNGYEMPAWEAVGERTQAAWEAGANAVKQHVLSGVVNMMQQAIAEQEAEKAGHA